MVKFSVMAALALAIVAGSAAADPKRLTWPADYPANYTLYGVHNRPDNGQVRYLYANKEAVEGAKKDGALPNGSVLIMEIYKAKVGPDNQPIAGADGLWQKGDFVAYGAMAKQAGWGNDIPENIRNNDWNYTFFAPDKTNRTDTNEAACLTCHKMITAAADYVFSYDELVAKVRGTVPRVTSQSVAGLPGDADRGKSLFTRCTNCHTADATGKHKVGPNLAGVVGRKAGSAAGYAYSPALSRTSTTWDEASLEAWLISPGTVVNGTKMVFQGFPKGQDRADVIAYLKTLK